MMIQYNTSEEKKRQWPNLYQDSKLVRSKSPTSLARLLIAFSLSMTCCSVESSSLASWSNPASVGWCSIRKARSSTSGYPISFVDKLRGDDEGASPNGFHSGKTGEDCIGELACTGVPGAVEGAERRIVVGRRGVASSMETSPSSISRNSRGTSGSTFEWRRGGDDSRRGEGAFNECDLRSISASFIFSSIRAFSRWRLAMYPPSNPSRSLNLWIRSDDWELICWLMLQKKKY